MKILILGLSGSGKSTLAKYLSDRLHLPLLYLDQVHFSENWIERSDADVAATVAAFLSAHPDGWVIDGNYQMYSFAERLEASDRIIILLFPRLSRLFRLIRRRIRYHGRVRESVAPGCSERLDFAFLRWILLDGCAPARMESFRLVAARYPDKVQIIKNQRELDALYRLFRN